MGKGALPPSVKAGKPVLGSCPSDWNACTYGDLFKIIERPVKLIDDEKYQLVTVKRSRGGVVPREKLTGRDIKTKSAFEIREGDFLISNRQIVHGACALVPTEMSGAIVSGEYTVLNAVNGASLEYLQHFSNSLYFQQSCYHSSIGVDIEKMVFKLDRWLKTPVHFPNSNEQRKIAKILSCWDERIRIQTDLIEKALQLKRKVLREAFKPELFLQLQSEAVSEIPLGELASLITKGTTPTTLGFEFAPSGINFIKIESISDEGDFDPSAFAFIDEQTNEKLSRSIVVEGDILCSIAGALGRIAQVDGSIVPANINQALAIIRFTDEARVLRKYIRYFLCSEIVQSQIASWRVQSAQPNISLGDLKGLSILVPKLEIQKAIADCCTSIDCELIGLKRMSACLKLQKQALMQKLLTGELRVKV